MVSVEGPLGACPCSAPAARFRDVTLATSQMLRLWRRGRLWSRGRRRGGARRWALGRGLATETAAPAPAAILRGWRPHWSDEAAEPRRALCSRCGAQAGTSTLLERFICQPVAALPASAMLAISEGRFDAALEGAEALVRGRARAAGLLAPCRGRARPIDSGCRLLGLPWHRVIESRTEVVPAWASQALRLG